MIREGRVLISSATDPDFGSSYYVTAYEVGAQVTSGSSGTTITVRAGHGFATGDKLIVVSEFPGVTKYRAVSGTSATTLTVAAVSVSAGDILVNLGADTGTSSPNYDGNGLAIYTDMAYSTQATNNTVQADSVGRYVYYHQGVTTWELVRSALTAPFAVYTEAAQAVATGAASSTDNAVVLWSGTSGLVLKNSVVLVNAGATSGITTLSASGAVTFGSTLAITGALTGVTTLAASGLITGTAGITITGATSSFAATTVSSTLAVTGATTLTGGVTGAMTATGNVTSGGHVRGSLASVSLSASDAITTAGRFMIDITNTTGTNTPTLVAPSSVDGQILILRCAALTAGTFTFADSGNMRLTAAWTPNADDTLSLVANGVLWYETGRAAN